MTGETDAAANEASAASLADPASPIPLVRS
jgi:hypothetical protein